ncbi:DUF6174 domain-containing protein [Streptomyces asoensis]|uniref:Lipoprotein n=1 Tax=Streptomyces asoensis TaxID=249586 RepID=A0ABQ3RXN9_9ACTN|nr:DUF6174 domain-containing protein [Streptomyces asoensis]GGQ53221.1 hypothetical protein GCM10010496_14640 [Streptomyces asoensis]GHI60555.1 hypothetical protein Saso_22050 [Streptomyces asoensis]
MTAGPFRSRSAAAAALLGALACAGAGCGSAPSAGATAAAGPERTWQEPAAYTYTLTSSTQVLAGTFRVEVRDGKVVGVAGADADSRRQALDPHTEIPTIGKLLETLDRARAEHAHTAEADYADDGRPLRIVLDRDENSIDDEALYTISSYEPAIRSAP